MLKKDGLSGEQFKILQKLTDLTNNALNNSVI